MRPSNSGMIRNSAANLSLSPGGATVRWSVPLRMRPDVSRYAPPCQRLVPHARAPMRSSFPQIFRAVSCLVREIFKRHTDLVEPLSLDEAYLDVTENKTGLPTATRVARAIRAQIREELNLTA